MPSATQAIAAPQLKTSEIASIRTLLARFVLMCVGFALTMAAFGIWIVGSTIGTSEIMLMKLGVSLFMLISGMCMIVVAKDNG